jgi:hypothetical protein
MNTISIFMTSLLLPIKDVIAFLMQVHLNKYYTGA